MALIDDLKAAQKDAMRAKEKVRLGTIRMAMAAIKQKEIDEQITLDDSAILAVLTKMVKQRQDAAAQYDAANRDDLASKEREEITYIEYFTSLIACSSSCFLLLSSHNRIASLGFGGAD